MTEPAPRKSDLGVRVASAVVMVAVAGTALWLGGWVFAIFAVAIAFGIYWEWWGLVGKFVTDLPSRIVWMIGGALYVGLAAVGLIMLRQVGLAPALLLIASVVAVDVGAYFAGRSIGGPKIAPKISPSKTWAGLTGGIVAVIILLYASLNWGWAAGIWQGSVAAIVLIPVFGLLIAVLAQFGDFFESWMKRRAGVKDSGALIPGHGGLFDRLDGLIAVLLLVHLDRWLS